MIVKNIRLSEAIRLKKAVNGLAPHICVEISENDPALFSLGISHERLCNVMVFAEDDEVEALVDKVDELELAYAVAQHSKEANDYSRYEVIERYLSIGRYGNDVVGVKHPSWNDDFLKDFFKRGVINACPFCGGVVIAEYMSFPAGRELPPGRSVSFTCTSCNREKHIDMRRFDDEKSGDF